MGDEEPNQSGERHRSAHVVDALAGKGGVKPKSISAEPRSVWRARRRRSTACKAVLKWVRLPPASYCPEFGVAFRHRGFRIR